MIPTRALKILLGVTGTGLSTIALAAQTPSAAHEPHGVAADAALPPTESPIGAIHAHLCGFHFYSGDPKRAVRVEHYCSHLNADVLQCVIYERART